MRFIFIVFISVFSFLNSFALAADAQVYIVDMSSGLFRFQMKLASQGNPEAQYKVGEMFEAGKGTKKDNVAAIHWFEKAAAQGHEKSVYKLLYIEIQNNGLNDYSRTQLENIKTKAAAGRVDAQYYLGRMYASGVGVPKSLNNALTWLNKATFNGMSEAEGDAIAVEDELFRIRAEHALKRSKALAKAKKLRLVREKEHRQAQQKQQLEQDNLALLENKLKRQKETQRLLKERQNLATARAKMNVEKAQLEEMQRQHVAELQALQQKKVANNQRKKHLSTFETDPCKGKKARFLSTCR